MTRDDFLTALSGRLPYSKDEIRFMLGIVAEVIADGLASDEVVRTPLGTFKQTRRQARRYRDINSGEMKQAPEKSVIKYSPSKEVRSA